MKKIILSLIPFSFFLIPFTSNAILRLIKAPNSPTVYYIDDNEVRHAFPNSKTFDSWYEKDANVFVLGNDAVSQYPLGKNITIRPGKYPVKIPSASKVYAVEQGGLLRHIDNIDIAEKLYGKHWEQKIIDIPEVFFGDYTIGEPLVRISDIPNNIAYSPEGDDTIYWKHNEVLQPFASVDALEANGFLEEDVVRDRWKYYVRKNLIDTRSEEIFAPEAPVIVDASDCQSQKLNVAVLYLSKSNFDNAQVQKIETLKKEIPTRFAWATNDLSFIDISYPTALVTDDGIMVFENDKGQNDLTNEVTFSFYKNNPDIFDFIILFTDFQVFYDNNVLARFAQSSNHVSGIGQFHRTAAHTFGSFGKLKGVVNMGDIHKYEINTARGLSSTLNLVMHEIGHAWSGEIQFLNEEGEHDVSLLNPSNLNHWSSFVSWMSPLGGLGWQDNGDGTFTSLISQVDDSHKRKFSDFDLYLMGLLPAQVIEPQMYVVPDNPDTTLNTIAGTPRYVSIQQILDGNGRRSCLVE